MEVEGQVPRLRVRLAGEAEVAEEPLLVQLEQHLAELVVELLRLPRAAPSWKVQLPLVVVLMLLSLKLVESEKKVSDQQE